MATIVANAGNTKLAELATAGTPNTEADLAWAGALAGRQSVTVSANDATGAAHALTVNFDVGGAGSLVGDTMAHVLAATNGALQSSNDSTLQQITAVQDATGANINFINQQTNLTNQSNELSTFDTLLTSLQTAVQGLDTAMSGSSLQADYSSPNVVAATLGDGATEGVYSINVSNPGVYEATMSASTWKATPASGGGGSPYTLVVGAQTIHVYTR